VVVDPEHPAGVAAIVRELAVDRERLATMAERALQAAGSFARDRELQLFRRVIEDAV
jgi:hypothetical protein